MGAVAIVGIVFLMLSTIAFNGIRSEGRPLRLLEASLVADEVLADAETQALLGLPIELDTEGYGDLDADGEPEYIAFVETEPYDPLPEFAPADPRLALQPFVDPREPADPQAAANPIAMQRIQIDVYLPEDVEAEDEFTAPLASRTTFVIDPETLGLIPGSSGGETPETASDDEVREALGAEGDDPGLTQ